MPGLAVEVRIVAVEKSLAHTFNPLLYTIGVSHGQFQWTIRRRYHHFRNLHLALKVYRTGEVIKAAPKRMASRRESRVNKRKTSEQPTITVEDTSEDAIQCQQGGDHVRKASPSLSADSVLKPVSATTTAALPRFPKKPDSLLNQVLKK